MERPPPRGRVLRRRGGAGGGAAAGAQRRRWRGGQSPPRPRQVCGTRLRPPQVRGVGGGTTGRRGRDGGVLSVRGCSERDLLRGLPLGRGLCRCPQPVTRRRGSSEPGTPSPAPGRGAPGLCGLARAGGARRGSPDSPVPPLLGAGPVRCFRARPVLSVPGGTRGRLGSCRELSQGPADALTASNKPLCATLGQAPIESSFRTYADVRGFIPLLNS